MNLLKFYYFYYFVENSSSVDTDKGKKNTLVLGEDPADGLNDSTITAEAKYFINISKTTKKILFESTQQCIQQLFACQCCVNLSIWRKIFLNKADLLSLGNTSKDFTADNIKKQGLSNTCTIFLSAMIPLMPVILKIFTNI